MPSYWRPLWRWWRPRPRLEHVRIVVFTRANCPLCAEAAHFLEGQRRRLGFSLEFVDVDENEELRQRHGDSVPVVEVDGKVRFRGQINPVLWSRLVAALARRQ